MNQKINNLEKKEIQLRKLYDKECEKMGFLQLKYLNLYNEKTETIEEISKHNKKIIKLQRKTKTKKRDEEIAKNEEIIKALKIKAIFKLNAYKILYEKFMKIREKADKFYDDFIENEKKLWKLKESQIMDNYSKIVFEYSKLCKCSLSLLEQQLIENNQEFFTKNKKVLIKNLIEYNNKKEQLLKDKKYDEWTELRSNHIWKKLNI